MKFRKAADIIMELKRYQTRYTKISPHSEVISFVLSLHKFCWSKEKCYAMSMKVCCCVVVLLCCCVVVLLCAMLCR
jgi:hypothetical protein